MRKPVVFILVSFFLGMVPSNLWAQNILLNSYQEAVSQTRFIYQPLTQITQNTDTGDCTLIIDQVCKGEKSSCDWAKANTPDDIHDSCADYYSCKSNVQRAIDEDESGQACKGGIDMICQDAKTACDQATADPNTLPEDQHDICLDYQGCFTAWAGKLQTQDRTATFTPLETLQPQLSSNLNITNLRVKPNLTIGAIGASSVWSTANSLVSSGNHYVISNDRTPNSYLISRTNTDLTPWVPSETPSDTDDCTPIIDEVCKGEKSSCDWAKANTPDDVHDSCADYYSCKSNAQRAIDEDESGQACKGGIDMICQDAKTACDQATADPNTLPEDQHDICLDYQGCFTAWAGKLQTQDSPVIVHSRDNFQPVNLNWYKGVTLFNIFSLIMPSLNNGSANDCTLIIDEVCKGEKSSCDWAKANTPDDVHDSCADYYSCKSNAQRAIDEDESDQACKGGIDLICQDAKAACDQATADPNTLPEDQHDICLDYQGCFTAWAGKLNF